MIGFSYQNKMIEIKQSGIYHFTVSFHSEAYQNHIFIMSKLDADARNITEASCKLAEKMSSTCSTTMKVSWITSSHMSELIFIQATVGQKVWVKLEGEITYDAESDEVEEKTWNVFSGFLIGT